MGRAYHFRNLILWQRAQELGHKVIQLTRRLPQSWANAVIGRQIIASATSVAANIAEGHGRFSIGAHRNHLLIARGSVAETDSWIDLLCRDGALSADEAVDLQDRCDQLSAMLTTKIRALDGGDHPDNRQMKEHNEQYEAPDADMDAPVLPYQASDYV
jgi:four helix bundle protein